ncbi:MAG: cyclic nucleotide-binding domain-containing protein, partial [Alphaproteobacteria bacterium]
LFSAISPKNLKLLAFSSRRIEFVPGDNLIEEGERGEFAYVILGGEIEVVINVGKNEKIITRYGKNVLIGELALLTEALTTATVRAVTPVTALRIKKEVFIQLMEDDGRVSSQVASVVSNKLVQAMKLMNEAA